MSKLLEQFDNYLYDFINGNTETKLPKDDFNVRDVTVTNIMENQKTLFSTVHILLGYDNGSEMFTTNLGYKFRFRNKDDIQNDLEYISGNTYLFKNFKVKKERTIDYSELYEYEISSNSDLISLFGWAMDYCDERLFKKCCNENIIINRAGINGDSYQLKEMNQLKEFMTKDKLYYQQNQYSLVIQNETDNTVLTYHLYPANTGNKHLGSNTRYVQFYNEDVTFTIENQKISKIDFKRKERPLVQRSQIFHM